MCVYVELPASIDLMIPCIHPSDADDSLRPSIHMRACVHPGEVEGDAAIARSRLRVNDYGYVSWLKQWIHEPIIITLGLGIGIAIYMLHVYV